MPADVNQSQKVVDCHQRGWSQQLVLDDYQAALCTTDRDDVQNESVLYPRCSVHDNQPTSASTLIEFLVYLLEITNEKKINYSSNIRIILKV